MPETRSDKWLKFHVIQGKTSKTTYLLVGALKSPHPIMHVSEKSQHIMRTILHPQHLILVTSQIRSH